jgi:O-acetylserine/cysteine efflux transporter
MPGRHILLALTVAALWGVNFVAIDFALESFPPLLLAALRFGLVAFPAVTFLPRPPIAPWLIVAVGLSLATCQFGLLFVSIHVGMPAGLASLVMQLNAVFTVALAVAFLGERPGRRQLVGAVIAFGGIGLIAAERSGSHVPTGALILCVGGAASWGVGNIAVRVARAPNAIALMAWSALVAPLPLSALSFAFEGSTRIGHALAHASAKSIGGLLFVVIVASLFGFGSWAWLIRRHAASKVAPFSLLVPVFGIASAWLALGERPAAMEIVGAVVVICGLGLVSTALRIPRRAVHRAAPISVIGSPLGTRRRTSGRGACARRWQRGRT